MKARRVLLAAVAVLALSQTAYLILTGSQQQPLSWSSSRIPVRMQLWNGFTDSQPGIVAGSRPKLAIAEAINEWLRVSSISMSLAETGLSRTGEDGVNLITIADEQANRNVVGNHLAVALVWGLPAQIVEADVIFNPQARDPWSTVEMRDTLNLYDVAIHEFGHLLGMEHTIARTSRMFFQGGSFRHGLEGLAYDDLAGVNLLYPMAGIERITGSIRGRVTREGQPVFGAFVVAADEHGALAANSLSARDGSYRIDRLPPGRYTVYAEPLDGPTVPANLSGTLFDPVTDVVTDFSPAFYRGSMQPQVTVSAGTSSAGIDIQVSAGAAAVDPTFVGVTDNPQGAVRVITTAASGLQGSAPHFVAAGGGVENLPERNAFALLGSITTPGSVALTRSLPDLTFKFFAMDISRQTPRGEYSVFFPGGQLGVVTGGFHVFSPFRFGQAFGQFAHVPQQAGSQLLLINLDEAGEAVGRIQDRPGQPSSGRLSLTGLPRNLGGEFDFRLEPRGSLLTSTTGPEEFRGALVAESERQLGAAVLMETAFGTTGVGSSRPLYSFVAPVEVRSAGAAADTGLALANLDERDALVHLRLQDRAGGLVAETVLELAGREQLARFVRQLLASVPADFEGSLTATANRQVGATVIRTSPGVFTTFPVIENRAATRSLFPQFAHVGPLSSELILVNPSPSHAAPDVTVQVRKQDGSAAAVTLNGQLLPGGRTTLSLPPLGSVSLRSSRTEVVGWVEVTSSLPVGGVLLYRSAEVGTAGVGEGVVSARQVLPLDRRAGQGTDTGIAIVNAEGRAVRLTLTARDGTGSPVGQSRQLTLPAGGQLARFPNDAQLDLGLPGDFTGSLWVEADGRVAVAAIRQSPGVLTTLPAFQLDLPVTPAIDP